MDPRASSQAWLARPSLMPPNHSTLLRMSLSANLVSGVIFPVRTPMPSGARLMLARFSRSATASTSALPVRTFSSCSTTPHPGKVEKASTASGRSVLQP